MPVTMEEIKKALQLPRLKYYEVHLSFINCVLPKKSQMTPMEIVVLASFMAINGDLAQFRFGTTARKKVMMDNNLSPGGLSNYIGTLKEKELLLEDGKTFKILPLLIPEEKEQKYLFKLTNLN